MINNSPSFELIKFNKNDLQNLFSPRNGETKLGQVINSLKDAKYVIIGVEESVGPRANKGRPGAEKGFKTFLNTFLNMQSNELLIGDNICVLGKVVQNGENENDLSSTVEELDNFIFELLKEHILEKQIPIVIGGGHNNAFPLIQFSAHRFKKAINVVNLDAHADYRLLEGRHSGNPFSYAYKQAYLNQYHVFSLHQRYNSQQIIDGLRRDNHHFTFHEEYLMEERNYLKDFGESNCRLKKEGSYLGVELDLDVIKRMPSSAFSPVGITIETARKYLRTFATHNKIAYLHLPEGAPQTEEEDKIVGKTLAYFVSDFITVHG